MKNGQDSASGPARVLDSGPARVLFREQQTLTADDLTAEQAYRIAQRRRHNISQHGWGILYGLRLTFQNGDLLLLPGMAIDGYGRELIVPELLTIPTSALPQVVGWAVDFWLRYERVSESLPGPSGRWREGTNLCMTIVELEAAPPETPGVEEGAQPVPMFRFPPGVSQSELAAGPPLDLPDDPRVLWPVFLGRVMCVAAGSPGAMEAKRCFDAGDAQITAVPAEPAAPTASAASAAPAASAASAASKPPDLLCVFHRDRPYASPVGEGLRSVSRVPGQLPGLRGGPVTQLRLGRGMSNQQVFQVQSGTASGDIEPRLSLEGGGGVHVYGPLIIEDDRPLRSDLKLKEVQDDFTDDQIGNPAGAARKLLTTQLPVADDVRQIIRERAAALLADLQKPGTPPTDARMLVANLLNQITHGMVQKDTAGATQQRSVRLQAAIAPRLRPAGPVRLSRPMQSFRSVSPPPKVTPAPVFQPIIRLDLLRHIRLPSPVRTQVMQYIQAGSPAAATRLVLEKALEEHVKPAAPRGHFVQFIPLANPKAPARPWCVYRADILPEQPPGPPPTGPVEPPQPSRELRLEIGAPGQAGSPKAYQFAVGYRIKVQEDFHTCFSVDASGSIQIRGKLTVDGERVYGASLTEEDPTGAAAGLAQDWQQAEQAALVASTVMQAALAFDTLADDAHWRYTFTLKNNSATDSVMNLLAQEFTAFNGTVIGERTIRIRQTLGPGQTVTQIVRIPFTRPSGGTVAIAAQITGSLSSGLPSYARAFGHRNF